MQNLMWVMRLLNQQYFVHVFVDVRRCFNLAHEHERLALIGNICRAHCCRKIKYCSPSDQSLFVVIFDFYIDDMNWPVELAPSCQQIWKEGIGASGSETNLECVPSQTASKHRSSQVITTSATMWLSCHRSGAGFIRLFRSNICNNPLAVYLSGNVTRE
jgi:hypothetical protein